MKRQDLGLLVFVNVPGCRVWTKAHLAQWLERLSALEQILVGYLPGLKPCLFTETSFMPTQPPQPNPRLNDWDLGLQPLSAGVV